METISSNEINSIKILSQDTFRIIERIGSGCFGNVYKVDLLNPNQQDLNSPAFALKIISKEETSDIIKEASLLCRLHHDNVLPLMAITYYCGDPAMVMPFMENGDLLTYIRRSKSISVEVKMTFVSQIVQGMKYLAANHIVHRDLAARNIMLDQDLKVKISDFGLSRYTSTKNYYKMKHLSSLPFAWLPLESTTDPFVFNEKTDVYSFGVTVWEIFTMGKIPFEEQLKKSSLRKHLKRGRVLTKPVQCPKLAYQLLLETWDIKNENRPCFTEIESKLNQIENRNYQIGNNIKKIKIEGYEVMEMNENANFQHGNSNRKFYLSTLLALLILIILISFYSITQINNNSHNGKEPDLIHRSNCTRTNCSIKQDCCSGYCIDRTEFQMGICSNKIGHDHDDTSILEPEIWFYSKKNPFTHQHPDWMSQVPDNTYLHHLAIPGTHASLDTRSVPNFEYQSLSLIDQLMAGIRVLEVRVGHVNNQFFHYHQYIDLNLTLDHILTICGTFLQDHPTEVIIMFIKDIWWEQSKTNNTKTVKETFQYYHDQTLNGHLFWNGTKKPMIGEVRGKIVLFEFGHFKGIPSQQIDQLIYVTGGLYVTELDPIENHWNSVKTSFLKRKAHDKFHINWMNFKGLPYEMKTLVVSEITNERAFNLILKYDRKCRIVMMDYPGYGLIHNIIMDNSFINDNICLLKQ